MAISASAYVAGLLICSALPSYNYGTFTGDIKGRHVGETEWRDHLAMLPGTGQIEIAVFGSATTSGPDGVNNGLCVVWFDIIGSAIAGVMQQPMTLDANFTAFYFPMYGTYGLGFDQFASGGTGGVGTIADIGGSQLDGELGPKPFRMAGAFTANAQHANGLPPVPIATGIVSLGDLTEQGSPYFLETPADARAWKLDGKPDRVTIIQGSLAIYVIPEPGSLVMLGVAGLLLMRRGRW
jgi:hypothetical protein